MKRKGYEIVTRDRDSHDSRDWTNDGIGAPNAFGSHVEAFDAIEALIRLGDDWAGAAYSVRDIGTGEMSGITRICGGDR